ncbi:MAG: VOC family protein [Acidobacteria bacterium]|nr:VOC family protein [Acidobacteriota bacterium]
MSISHIPNGFTSITPYFIVENAERFISFIKEAFDAEQFEMHVEDGVIRHFGFRMFGSVIEGSQSNDRYKKTKFSIHLYVEDCEAVYKKALAAGGISLLEVADMPYGERSGGIEDPCGNSWWIATQTKDMYPLD